MVSWPEHTTNQSIAVVKSGTLLKRQNKLFRTCKLTKPTIEEINTRRKSAMPKKQRKTKDIVRMMWSTCAICGGLDCAE